MNSINILLKAASLDNKMKVHQMDTVLEIISKALNEKIYSIKEIKGFGCVNLIFEIIGKQNEYILRLNHEEGKWIEYRKERWCLDQVATLDIPSPRVLSMGMYQQMPYMIQTKVPGLNGRLCTSAERRKIWKKLGTYAAKFHQIKQIGDSEVTQANFHKDWKSRLRYNLEELNEADSLLAKKIFSHAEQKSAKAALANLESKDFKMGLVHGDLSSQNVLVDHDTVYLLDWGTAEINIVPHNEIGILQMSKEASEEEFQLFLSGLGISPTHYLKIAEEIKRLNLLHRLDKYRWAEGHLIENIQDYEVKVREAFEKINIDQKREPL